VKLPIVRLELSAGTFRIKTDEAIYEISVTAESGLARVVERIVTTEAKSDVPAQQAADQETSSMSAPDGGETFYKAVSEDMFKEIGKLARELSLSIATPAAGPMTKVDIEKAGVDLENAKGLLEDVVKMTEKATMSIMDISENIHEQCETIKHNLTAIKQMRFLGNAPAGEQTSDKNNLIAALVAGVSDRLHGIMALVQGAHVTADEAEPPPTPPEAAMQRIETYVFDLDVVFQTLYELCTNETVKKSHLKPMREHQKELFDDHRVMQMFAEMAPGVEREDDFFNFPLPTILKALFQCTDDEKARQVLKKMHQTADSLFLDQMLPVAGRVEVKEVPVMAAPAGEEARGGTEPGNAALESMDEVEAFVRSQCELLCGLCSDGEKDYSMIRREDHQRLVAALESTDSVIQNIIANITQILESLSFKDLSGQRIKKIVAVLTHVQIQLLGILVSFGVKLKKREEDRTITASESETIALQEVDKIMKRFSEVPADNDPLEGTSLNQHEVDRLLADLGF